MKRAVACASLFLAIAACSQAAPSSGVRGDPSQAQTGGDRAPSGADEDTPASNDDGTSGSAGPGGGRAADAGADTGTSRFSCTPAGIAAYADALAQATRTSCTSDGVGVVKQDDYTCMQAPIDQLNPPHKDASFNVVKTLLATNTDYPNYECTYFVQTVTAGVCGTPISPNDTPWTDYPLAYTFVGKTITGYTWMANDGQKAVQPGDILVYDTTGGYDPGHIMIVAAMVDATHFRIAEANELNSDGSRAVAGETGVVSNTRIDTVGDRSLTGWFRRNADP